jgi:hypothetical protein
VNVLRSLSLNNVLTMGVLAVVAVPSYFAWKFMTDTQFRHEFMSTARVVQDAGVPCQVILGNLAGEHGGDRYSIFVEYRRLGPYVYLVSIRSGGLLSQSEIVEACNIARAQADLITWAQDQKDEIRREMDRGKPAQGAH